MSADADIAADADLYGKTVADLQSDVAVGDDAITGTLAYVSDYTGFSEDTDLQAGNFLALHFDVSPGASLAVTLGEDSVDVDEDGIVVLRIADKDEQITATATRGDETVTVTYGLTGLDLESAGG